MKKLCSSFLFLISILSVQSKTTSYTLGDVIPLYYNKLFSLKNPFTVSFGAVGFSCPSARSREKSFLVFDQDLTGDRHIPTDYSINFLEDQECRVLCKKSWQIEDAIEVEELIDEDYQVELELDGLPGATVSYTNEAPEHNYKIGYPLGFKKNDEYYINNHLVFQMLINKENEIIGFEVYPDSIAEEEECTKKNVDYNYQRVTNRRTQILFTYSVQWKRVLFDDKRIPTQRWQAYFTRSKLTRHTVAYTNGLFITLFTSLLLVFVILKIRNSPLISGNSNDDKDRDLRVFDESVEDMVGWKLINRDVFRRPIYGGVLTPLVGSGLQLAIVSISMAACFKWDWLQPMQSGSFVRWFTLFFLLGSAPGGYYSAKVYRAFKGKSWVLNAILTASIVPCTCLLILVVYSMLAWTHSSSLAVSMSGWASLFSLWFFVTIPLTIAGAYVGERAHPIEYPSRTTQLPRTLPVKKWFESDILRTLLCGIIPFTVIFLQWHELLTSRFVTGADFSRAEDSNFLSLSLFYLTTASEMATLFTFFKLCSEDYIWWWSSLAFGASSTLYLFGYGILLFFKHTPFALSSMTLSGSCMFLLKLLMECFLIAICTSACGFISSYLFIRKIYSTRKVD